jgi:hypothetical protein
MRQPLRPVAAPLPHARLRSIALVMKHATEVPPPAGLAASPAQRPGGAARG